jgi:hypothetical protein
MHVMKKASIYLVPVGALVFTLWDMVITTGDEVRFYNSFKLRAMVDNANLRRLRLSGFGSV